MENYYKQKMIKSGKMIEIYEYEKGVFHRRSGMTGYTKPVGRAKTAEQKDKTKNRLAALRRAKKIVIRAIHSNAYRWADEDGVAFAPLNVTLTFKQNVKDVQRANKEFRAFIKRLNYHVYKKKVGQLKYVATIEFQERGAVHYHCIFFNLPRIEGETLTATWKKGNANIRQVQHVGRMANYVTKNMTDLQHDERLAGQKSYLNSNGLLKPEKTTNEAKINAVVKKSDQTYQAKFKSDYYGEIKYQRRKPKRSKKKNKGDSL